MARYEVKVPAEDIDDVLNWAADAEESGERHFPGMSYEEGVRATLDWVLGHSNERPDSE